MDLFIEAAYFAAVCHRNQRRKGALDEPYINHLLEVAQLLSAEGIDDVEVLAAAVLHDAVEDVAVSFDDIRERFGARVSNIVRELTDDMRLDARVRKRIEVANASAMSAEAQAIKVADKLSNVRAIERTPPRGWTLERKRDYCDFAQHLVEHCVQAPPPLIEKFKRTHEAVVRTLDAS